MVLTHHRRGSHWKHPCRRGISEIALMTKWMGVVVKIDPAEAVLKRNCQKVSSGKSVSLRPFPKMDVLGDVRVIRKIYHIFLPGPSEKWTVFQLRHPFHPQCICRDGKNNHTFQRASSIVSLLGNSCQRPFLTLSAIAAEECLSKSRPVHPTFHRSRFCSPSPAVTIKIISFPRTLFFKKICLYPTDVYFAPRHTISAEMMRKSVSPCRVFLLLDIHGHIRNSSGHDHGEGVHLHG